VKASLAQQCASIASFSEVSLVGNDTSEPSDSTGKKSKKKKKSNPEEDSNSSGEESGGKRDRAKARKFFQVKDHQLIYVTWF